MNLCDKCVNCAKCKLPFDGIKKCSGFVQAPEISREAKIEYIKSFKEPPFDAEDPYYKRSPWPRFGTLVPGICEEWGWFINMGIDIATDAEVDAAYKETVANESTLVKYERANLCISCMKKRRCGHRGESDCAAYFPMKTVLDYFRCITDDEWAAVILYASRLLYESPCDLSKLWCLGTCEDVGGEVDCNEEKRMTCIKNWLNSPIGGNNG